MRNAPTPPKYLRKLKVEDRSISALKPNKSNSRTHTKKQIRQIADSIEQFGFNNPALIDNEGGIIAGHGRVDAAKLLGISKVPTICLEDMSEAQKRAYIIADNKLAENAGWDPEILAIELQHLLDVEIDFDVTITGFETPEIDLIIEGVASAAENDPDDEIPPIPEEEETVSRLGDLWLLGRHRLICGNALEGSTYEVLMQGERAQMVFSYPPYNVPIDGHVSGLGKVRHKDFSMASGEMSEWSATASHRNTLATSPDDRAIQKAAREAREAEKLLSKKLPTRCIG